VQKNLEKLAVIIPCFNEEISIANVIRDIKINLDAKIEYEIYVIDNNSTDLTSRVALENGAKIIFEERIGKGFAVLTAFRKINADYYILIDGDNTYDTTDINYVVKKLQEKETHVLVTREHSEDNSMTVRARLHLFGNKLITKLTNYFFGLNLEDSLSGYRGFSKGFVKTFTYNAKGFEIEAYLNLHSSILEIPVCCISSKYRDRQVGSFSKLRTIKDGLNIVSFILKKQSEWNPGVGLLIIGIIVFLFNLIDKFIGGINYDSRILDLNFTLLTFMAVSLLALGLILKRLSDMKRKLIKIKFLEY